jgi:hypothetical protein
MLPQAVRRGARKVSPRPEYAFGSYFRMVSMFAEVEQMAGNKVKLGVIREFKDSLSQEERQDFDGLMGWYARKESIRVSSKVVNKYYLTKKVSAIDHSTIEPQLAEGGVMRLLSQQDT